MMRVLGKPLDQRIAFVPETAAETAETDALTRGASDGERQFLCMRYLASPVWEWFDFISYEAAWNAAFCQPQQ